MSRSLRERLLAGERLVGPMVTLSSPEVCELFAEIGYDWLFIDAEHTPMEAAAIQRLLQAAGSTPCLVRLGTDDPAAIAKALDIGSAGIIVAQVNTAAQARDIVAAAKYAPAGRRGRGLARAHRYGVKLAEYGETANDTVAVIVQAEHADAVRNIREIVRVEGLDAILVGPYDLASSLGHTGDVDHPEVRAAIKDIRRACADVGMPTGILGLTAESLIPHIRDGFTLLIAGVDVLMLGQTAKAMLEGVNGVRS